MAALVDDLNDLLEHTRGIFEAVEMLADEIEATDPDIERGLQDILDAERWTASGLYHRITQLHGTPNLRTTDFPSRLSSTEGLDRKLKAISRKQESLAREARAVFLRDDVDAPTKALLDEMRALHLRNADWCKTILQEWEPTGTA